MRYQLIVRPEAEADITQAFNWYEEQSNGLGAEFVRAVDACLASITRNPLAYSIIYKQTRRALLRRFPYGVFYHIDTDSIVIIACLHARRSPKEWRSRN